LIIPIKKFILNFVFVFLYFLSHYPRSKRYSYNDEQIVESRAFIDRRSRIKQRSIGPFSTLSLYKMQQDTITDPNIGVSSPLCSVCGDISTGKYSFKYQINNH
jgi:hypothetical protein